MWAGLETGGGWFKSSLLTFSPLSLFPMQMSDCHSPSEPDGWAECAAHTHTLTWGGVGGGGGGGGGGGSGEGRGGDHGSVASVPPFRPSVRQTPRKEWIIYNHFSSGSSDWCDSWPPNSPNLVICHSRGKKKWNHSRVLARPLPLRPPPRYPALQRGQYGEPILDDARQRNDFPFNRRPDFAKTARLLAVNDSVAICIVRADSQFVCRGLRWCIAAIFTQHESFLCVGELQAAHKQDCVWKIVSCSRFPPPQKKNAVKLCGPSSYLLQSQRN